MAAVRWIQFLAIAAIFLISRVSCGSESESDSTPHVSRIAFGSCANQSAPQPIWDAINDFDPQLFIWLGDNIYGDNRRPFRIFGKERTIGPWKNMPRFYPALEKDLKNRYEMEKRNAGYSALRRRSKVIGTWDDHDYGLNDAGKEFSGKNTSQRLLLDFLDEAEDSPRRRQAGVYASYLFGPPGKQIKVILLDTRYHRDPLCSDGSILGETQWEWLQQELYGPGSQITIIASSIQVVSYRPHTAGMLLVQMAYPYGIDAESILAELPRGSVNCTWSIDDQRSPLWRLIGLPVYVVLKYSDPVVSNLSATTAPLFSMESWGRFPKERKRLFRLITDSKRSGVFFISGDVHFGEITRYDGGGDYSLYDITSSGLTQAVEKAVPRPLAFLVRVAAWLTPSTMRIFSPNCRFRSCTYAQPNFGAIEIDWDANPQSIKIEVRDVNGNATMGVDFLLSELQSRNTQKTCRRGGEAHRPHCTLEIDLPWIVRYRLAFLFFGTIAGFVVAIVLLTISMLSVSKKLVRKYKID